MDKNKFITFLDYIVLAVLGIFSFLYALFFSYFAKLHITFKLLNVPIFVGEMLLGFCLLMLVLKICLLRKNYKTSRLLLIFCYILFVLIKTFLGYIKFGPLSFRHAALFYYPLFMLIGLSFYRRSFFNSQRVIISILLMLIAAFVYQGGVYVYYTFISLLLGFMLIFKIKNIILKYVILAGFLIAFPYWDLFDSGRTRIIGNTVGSIILAGLLVKAFLKIGRKWKLAFLGAFLIFFIFAISKIADKNAILSITSWEQNMGNWSKKIELIEENKQDFKFASLPVRVFPENKLKKRMNQNDLIVGTHENSRLPKGYDPQARSIEEANNNILFRFLIWRDMIEDMIQKKPVFGIDFGYPFRSKSLEILRWADDAWGLDGWIAAHNSYLEMIYRAGIIGIVLVILIFYSFFFLLRFFTAHKSLAGIFLISIFAFCLTAANFTVFFEVPYTAILFWLLLGMSFAYSSDLKTDYIRKNPDYVKKDRLQSL